MGAKKKKSKKSKVTKVSVEKDDQQRPDPVVIPESPVEKKTPMPKGLTTPNSPGRADS